MTVSLLTWYLGTAVWGGALLGAARRRRYAPAYLSAALALACAYGLGFLPMLVAVPALLACGASIAERRLPPEARAMLLSGAVQPALPSSDHDLIRRMKAAEMKAEHAQRAHKRYQ